MRAALVDKKPFPAVKYSMTSTLTSSLEILDAMESPAPPRLTKAQQRDELDKMGEAMMREKGLLNAAQAAIWLDRSRERVYELMELGILKKFEFLGRIYLSFEEVRTRREADIKAGRPARNLGQRIKMKLKYVAAADGGQRKFGGTTEYAAHHYAKKKAKRKK